MKSRRMDKEELVILQVCLAKDTSWKSSCKSCPYPSLFRGGRFAMH